MKVEKKVIGNLAKCYSIAPLHYQGADHLLVAAEKVDRCILFDLDGNEEDTVWTEPGGAMSMVQVPGTEGQFLSTYKCYSPNDSMEARIVYVTPRGKGDWEVTTLVDLPHVHRFDILERGGVRYLIACTLKSGHEFKEDWSKPGKVYAAVLPDDLSVFNQENQLHMEVVKDGLTKNHGYYRVDLDGTPGSVVSAEDGVFLFTPPAAPGGQWGVERLLDTPASDALLADLDGDGEQELAVIAPFHGDSICIYKKEDGRYRKVYEYDKPAEFAHSIFGGMLCGKPRVVIGHRKGTRDLLAFTYNQDTKSYEVQILDKDCGSANVFRYTNHGKDVLISTNREIDEIAMYILEP
ncbi:MAG: hypothetical protein LIP16_15800 [Clostridium sp.]|nr:hypothetical protein [Clostridium sp.]